MDGHRVQLVGGGHLHQMAQIHDRDAVGNVMHHQQVMGDEQIGHAQLFLQVLEHIDHLRLNGHVQRGDRLVTDDELGVHRQRAGNADALTLAAGELMGIAHGVLGVEADGLHQLHDPLAALLFVGAQLVDVQRLADDVLHRHAGVQRGVGVLKHHLHLLAVGQHIFLHLGAQHRLAVGVHLQAAVLVILFAAVKQHLAVKSDSAGSGIVQLEQRAAHGGLAAAGFAHQTQRFAGTDGKGNIIHGLQRRGAEQAGLDGEILFEVLNF